MPKIQPSKFKDLIGLTEQFMNWAALHLVNGKVVGGGSG